MQVTLNPGSAAELRLLSAFFNDYAELVELKDAPEKAITEELKSEPVVEEAPAPAKKPRKPKPEPVIEEAPAPVDTQPVVEETPAVETETATESPSSVTHDDLRVVFGQLAQVGKRDEAVRVIKGHGFNGIGQITDDKLATILAQLKDIK